MSDDCPCEVKDPSTEQCTGEPKPNGADSDNADHVCCEGTEYKEKIATNTSFKLGDNRLEAALSTVSDILKSAAGGCTFKAKPSAEGVKVEIDTEYECCQQSDEYLPKLTFSGSGIFKFGLDCTLRVPTPIPSVIFRGDAFATVSADAGLSQVLTGCDNENRKCETFSLTGEIGASAGAAAGWCLVSGDLGASTSISGDFELCAGDDGNVEFASASASASGLKASAKICELCGLFCQEFEVDF